MMPDKRVDLFLSVVIGAAFVIHLLNLPVWLMSLITDVGVSFVISGIFYAVLLGFGLDFLEEIRMGAVSAMTVVVFVLKHLLI